MRIEALIGIAGRRASGKGETARALVRDHGFREISFAHPIKAMARTVFGFTERQLFGPSESREERVLDGLSAWARGEFWGTAYMRTASARPWLHLFIGAPYAVTEHDAWARLFEVLNGLQELGDAFTPRAALQKLGTEWGRALWGDVWVHAALRDALAGVHGPRVCLSDMRFPNEARAVRDAGGEVWWIERPSVARDTAADAHASEPRSADFDGLANVQIINNGSLDSLRATVHATRTGVFSCSAARSENVTGEEKHAS